jgi:hypothetical protein
MEEWRHTVDVSDQPGELRDLLVGVELLLGSGGMEKVASIDSFALTADRPVRQARERAA